MKVFTKGHLYFTITGIVTLAALYWGTALYLQAVNYAETTRGVDVYIVAPTAPLALDSTFSADILITNDKTPLNVMEAEVYFDPALFKVTDFTFSNSLCEDRFIIDKAIDNDTGHLHVSCGTITPFTGNATIFGTIHAVTLTSGVTNLTFGEKTHVYVHDGLGTEVARDTYSATLVVSGA